MAKIGKYPLGLIAIIILVFLAALLFLFSGIVAPTLSIVLFGIVVAIILFLIGIGLIMFQEIARKALIVLYGILIVVEIILAFFIMDVATLIRVIIMMVVIFYLSKPEIKELFH